MIVFRTMVRGRGLLYKNIGHSPATDQRGSSHGRCFFVFKEGIGQGQKKRARKATSEAYRPNENVVKLEGSGLFYTKTGVYLAGVVTGPEQTPGQG